MLNSETRSGRRSSPGWRRIASHAVAIRSAGFGVPIRRFSRRQSSACHLAELGTGSKIRASEFSLGPKAPSSARLHAWTISGRCNAYRENSSARCRTVLNRRAPRCGSGGSMPCPRYAARLAAHASSSEVSTTSSSGHTDRSGRHGSAPGSTPDASATASPIS
jgi:hypothetical protein